MKFSRVFWLILAAGICITGGILLFMLYQDEADEQNMVEEQLALAQSELPVLNNHIIDLEGQIEQLQAELAQAQAELAIAEDDFINSVDSVEYGDTLFSIARILDLQIINFASSGPSTVQIDDIDYQSMHFNITVEGYIYNILSYLTRIELGEDFVSTIIEVVDSNITEPGGDAWTTQANISINILYYGGD